MGAVITTGGEFTWTPAETQGPNNYTFQVCVSDGALNDCQDVNVTVDEVNVAPELSAIGNQSVDEGNELTFTATATDADLPANTLTFSLTGEPAGAVITTGGIFTWTPTEAQGPGTYNFDVCVSDGNLTDCQTIQVTVSEINTSPVLASIGNKTVDEGSLLTFTATASDTDLPANTLVFSLGGTPPAGANIDPVTGVFTWTPTESQGPGINVLNINVTDGITLDVETIVVTVNEVNTPPVAVAQTLSTVEDTALNITLTGTDQDLPANPLTFTVVTNPAHGILSGQAPALMYTPAANFKGNDSFTFKVNDGTVDSDIVLVTIAVKAPQCVNPANEIVAENCLTGNPPSEWDVSGAGDANIQGYATDISVNQGGTIHFKVDTDASDYRLDIYRLGYYDGNGARFIATVNPSATLPQTQPDLSI